MMTTFLFYRIIKSIQAKHFARNAREITIREIYSFGVDEIIAMPLVLPEEKTAVPRTVELLGSLARE